MSGRVLGWYEPNGYPTSDARSEDPDWLIFATSQHENAHAALASASTHGHAEAILERAAVRCHSDSLPSVERIRAILHESAFLTHEGAATLHELACLQLRYGLEFVNVRWDTIGADYRAAVHRFDWLVRELVKLELRVDVASLLTTSVALACLRTAILDLSSSIGLVHDDVLRLASTPDFAPDHRLQLLGESPQDSIADLIHEVDRQISELMKNDERDPALASPMIDRIVESWIRTNDVFVVAEAPPPPPATEWELVRTVEDSTGRALEVDLASRSTISTLNWEFQERRHTRRAAGVDHTKLVRLTGGDQLRVWMSQIREVGDSAGMEIHFAGALIAAGRLRVQEQVSLLVTALFEVDRRVGEDAERVYVSPPSSTVHASIALEACGDAINCLIDVPLGIDPLLERECSMHTIRDLVDPIRSVYICTNVIDLSLAPRIGECCETFATYDEDEAFPAVVAATSEDEKTHWITLATSYGVEELASRLEDAGLARKASPGLPFDTWLGVWHHMFGALTDAEETQVGEPL